MNRAFAVLTGLALFVALAGSPALAQLQMGSILLKAVDEQGAVVPGVVVTISSPVLVSGQMTGTTDAGGYYRFPSLPPGVYSVKLELQGFSTVVRENVIVSAGQTASLEVTMALAALAETVTVSGQSPVVDTTSANVNVTIKQQLLQAMPGGRDIWSLLEYQVPSLTTTRPDVGGNAGGLQASFTARGTSTGQSTQYVNGLDVTNPGALGAAGYYYDYDAFEEVQVSTGAHDLSISPSGVSVNMVTKTGTDRYKGQGSFYWQGRATQSANVDEALLDFGFRKDAGSVDFRSDANFQLGGPAVKNRLRFFTSVRDWRVHVNIPGFPEIEETNVTSVLGNVTWQVNNKNRLTGFVSRQYYKKPNRNASALNNPTSNSNEDDVFDIDQIMWNSVLRNNAFAEAGFSYLSVFFPLQLKGRDQSLFDQATGFLDRAAQVENIFTRQRFQANANFQYYVDQALGGRHELRVGFDHSHSPVGTAQNRIDDLNLFWNSTTGRGTEVGLFNSPVRSVATVNVTGLFAQDAYTVKRLTLAGGLRWERLEGYLPDQESPPSPWFPNLPRKFAAVRDIINTKNLAPRLSVVYDLYKGKTAVKASAARYYYAVGTGTPNSVNPNFVVSDRYVWNDLNSDLHFQPGELGRLLSRTGGLNTSIDANFRRPRTDEATMGLDHELVPNLRLSVVFAYRRERDQFGNLNVGVPFSAYTPVVRTDPGRDGIVGTSDDNPNFVVYSQDPTTLGRDQFLVTNSPALNQDYRGLEITASKRMSNRWQMLAGYTVSRAIQNARSVTSPNELINARGPVDLDRTHIFKLTGSYLFPRDILVSGNFRTQTGRPVTRQVRFTVNQGSVTVNAEPGGSERLDNLTTVDVRVAKILRFSHGRELELLVDGYNLANANTVHNVRTLTGRLSVPVGGTGERHVVQQYLSPTEIIGPRIFRFGAAYRF